MSNTLFPTLPGQSIECGRSPEFSTRIQKAVSRKETRAAFMAYPIWTLTVKYNFLQDGLRGDDLQTLEGFFLQMRGAWDSFLVAVPSDTVANAMPFGTGDGNRRVFQLTRTRGANGYGFTEPCQNIAAVGAITVDGTPLSTSGYSLDGTGLITFVTAPALSADLAWTGTYYFRCRLAEDDLPLDRFLDDLWKTGELPMIGAPGNKV